MDFTGKVALVTGSGGGIGLATAKALAEAGADVAILDFNPALLETAKAEVEAYGHKVITIQCDVSKADQVDAAVKATIDAFGRLDILVNNAGITRDNLLLRMEENEWDAVIATNLKSVYLFSKAVIRPMGKNKGADGKPCGGVIINVASVIGLFGNVGQLNYGAAKAGVINMTKTISKEYGKKKIRCNAVAPGFIKTKMTEVLSQEAKDAMAKMIPLQELGEPEDVARAIRFLASDEASYITGQTLAVSGGMAF
jgi:3-oxoacyl-[acyl-carrier protein] reductase